MVVRKSGVTRVIRATGFSYTAEFEKSKKRGNGLLGIDVSKIQDLTGRTSTRCGQIPGSYDYYLWSRDNGYVNLGHWVERAARAARR